MNSINIYIKRKHLFNNEMRRETTCDNFYARNGPFVPSSKLRYSKLTII